MKIKLNFGRILLLIAILCGSGIFIYAQKDSKPIESNYDTVERLSSTYANSGYVTGYDYEDDINSLQWIKQQELDLLDYEDTYQYIKTQTIDDEFITKIDAVIKYAKQLKSQEPVPAYLKMQPVKEEVSASPMDFINLLK